jgi:hypothetical protein
VPRIPNNSPNESVPWCRSPSQRVAVVGGPADSMCVNATVWDWWDLNATIRSTPLGLLRIESAGLHVPAERFSVGFRHADPVLGVPKQEVALQLRIEVHRFDR